MVCIDARKEIFNTLSQNYGKACSDVMMIIFESKLETNLLKIGGGLKPPFLHPKP